MSKLTLSVDERVIFHAKRYAKEHGLSLSRMVEAYLATVAESLDRTPEDSAPVLQSVRGCLKKADPEAYRNHLTAKYR